VTEQDLPTHDLPEEEDHVPPPIDSETQEALDELRQIVDELNQPI